MQQAIKPNANPSNRRLKGERILKELADFIVDDLREIYGEKIATAGSKSVIDCLRLNFSNGHLYIPSNTTRERLQRNKLLVAEFNGFNHDDLALKYGLCTVQVYSILRKSKLQSTKQTCFIGVIEDQVPLRLIRTGIQDDAAHAMKDKIIDFFYGQYPGLSMNFCAVRPEKK